MAPQQQQGGQDGAGLDFLWVVALLVGGIWASWYFGKEYIIGFVYGVRYFEIECIRFVLAGWNILASQVGLPPVQAYDLHNWSLGISSRSMGNLFNTLLSVSTGVGNYLRFATAPFLLALAWIVYRKSASSKFKTIFDMKRMRQIEQQNWPQITPVTKLNLTKQDIDEGPWAMAMTPMQFCKKHSILKEKTDENGRPAVELIRPSAHQLFLMQLGPLWTNVQALPIYAQALFAIFGASGNHERDDAFKLLQHIAQSSAAGKLDFTGTRALLQKQMTTKVVTRVLQRHAYVATIFASMLELARTDGVLATSEFLWLKPLDRKLWYVLNTVGRQTPAVEAAGPFAHWLAEKKWGGGLRTPMVEEAVKALEVALSEILYEPED